MRTKDDFLAQVQETIHQEQAKLEQLKAAAMDESQIAIDDIRDAINSLEPKLEHAKAKAMEIIDTADDRWDDLKVSVEQGWDEASTQLEQGWNTVNDSIKKMCC